MQFRRCQYGIPYWNRAKKGYFSTFSRRWGRENTLRAAIAQRGGWRRPIYVPGAERGAAGASRGRAGAEKRKSSFFGARRDHSSLDQIVQYFVLIVRLLPSLVDYSENF